MEREEQARLHDAENREELAIRREEREMAAEERELEREMEAFKRDEERAKAKIENELRHEHWGHEPEREPAWEEPGD